MNFIINTAIGMGWVVAIILAWFSLVPVIEPQDVFWVMPVFVGVLVGGTFGTIELIEVVGRYFDKYEQRKEVRN